ncbi:MAG: aldo/keto reductase [Bryobacteraceae bacterium]|jgi:aryl-alcohol dehydrogenase-like predicted oxidoreductase
MVYRRLGRTSIDVSLLSFGSHTDWRYKPPEGSSSDLTLEGQQRRDRIAAHAVDLGINMFDVYPGQWEATARYIKGRRDKFVLSLATEYPGQFTGYRDGKDIERAARLFGYVDMWRFWTEPANAVDGKMLEWWDTLRKGKEAGLIRAIGVASHTERIVNQAVEALEGLDYVFIPYNFIHAVADYGEFVSLATSKGIGIVGMKPLAAGSIRGLDPSSRTRGKPGSEPMQVWISRFNRSRPLLAAAAAELTRNLDRMEDETLCQAAMRFAYSRPFLSTALCGMQDDVELVDNYRALARYREMQPEEHASLDAARRLVRLRGTAWLPAHYRWLEEQWGV